jgi:uncharacterized membrane protein
MISNHYALTYGARHNWLVLIAMSFAGACIRAWFVARHKPRPQSGLRTAAPALLAVVALLGVMFALAPEPGVQTATALGVAPPVSPDRVEDIVARRCAPCHAVHPSQPGFNAAPDGLVLGNLAAIAAHAPQIAQQLATHSMPLGNLTGMTDEERAAVLAWIAHEAPR